MYAINTAYRRHWDLPIERYVRDCEAGVDGPRGQDFNMRWAGAAVAEAHRVLWQGGVCLYPPDRKTQKLGGRLRLLYEVNPLGYIIEQAGGLASNSQQSVLDIEPQTLHQRCPVIFGECTEVERVLAYYREQG